MKTVSTDYTNKEEATKRRPAELFHIWRNSGDSHWYYTNGDKNETFDGDTYQVASIERGLVKYDIELEVSTMDISFNYLAEPFVKYITQNPLEVLWISVMKVHRDMSPLEADVIYIGQIEGANFKGGRGTAQGVGFEHFLKKNIPVWRYLKTCNHDVFDSNCSLSDSSYKVTDTVTVDATGSLISSPLYGLQSDGYFTGGKLVFGEEARTIVAHSGNQITLMYKMVELETGDSADAYPGCDGRIETCKDKFDNLNNFLGFPFIPEENPATRVEW